MELLIMLTSTPVLVAAIVFVTLLGFVLPRVGNTNPGKLDHWMDVVLIFLAICSFITLNGDVRSRFASSMLNYVHSKTETSLDRVGAMIQSDNCGSCRDFIKNGLSPNNLEEIQAEYRNVCAWFSEQRNMWDRTQAAYHSMATQPRIDCSPFAHLPKVNDAALADCLKSLSELEGDFISSCKKQAALTQNIAHRPYETIFLGLSPFLTCITIGLLIAKLLSPKKTRRSSQAKKKRD